jgi:hypothetical protein
LIVALRIKNRFPVPKSEHDLFGKPVPTFPDHALKNAALLTGRCPLRYCGMVRARLNFRLW